MTLSRTEQLARSRAWQFYVSKRRLLFFIASGKYPPQHKEYMKKVRRKMAIVVRDYPDFPERYVRKGLVGSETPPTRLQPSIATARAEKLRKRLDSNSDFL